MRRLLLISPDIINRKMAGPAIRYLNFAKELNKYFDVTLYIPNTESDFDFSQYKFQIIWNSVGELQQQIKSIDVIVVQGIAFRKYSFLKKCNKPIIVDLYDPFTLENLELRKNLSLKDRLQYHETDLDIILEQLSIGDYFICASEKQKDYWIGMLAAINRVNPCTYMDSSKLDKLIGVVPFGLDNEEPIKTKKVLKDVWPGIEENDKVLIWGGGIWNWFDPITLIEAMKIIYEQRQDIKLFFMGIGHPNSETDMSSASQCIELCKKYGLYNKTVFFNDWVPYEERQNYLMEGDIGVSTYFDNLETRYSFRTRVLDYIWCGIPMILTKGDYMADLVESGQMGLCHKEKDSEELSNIIINLLNNQIMYSNFKENIKFAKDEFKWENIIAPIIKFCEQPYSSSDKKEKVKILYSKKTIGKFKYYYVRLKKKIKIIFNIQ